MSNYQHKKPYSKKYQPTILEVIIIGLGKALWWLITLPFRGLKISKKNISAENKQYIVNKRGEIENMLKSENIHELRQAVLEADKLVDYILKIKGYSGESFADRLRFAEKIIDGATYQALWDGHKIRNQIAHDDNNHSNSSLREATIKLLTYCRL